MAVSRVNNHGNEALWSWSRLHRCNFFTSPMQYCKIAFCALSRCWQKNGKNYTVLEKVSQRIVHQQV